MKTLEALNNDIPLTNYLIADNSKKIRQIKAHREERYKLKQINKSMKELDKLNRFSFDPINLID
jgi:hypothetical protein